MKVTISDASLRKANSMFAQEDMDDHDFNNDNNNNNNDNNGASTHSDFIDYAYHPPPTENMLSDKAVGAFHTAGGPKVQLSNGKKKAMDIFGGELSMNAPFVGFQTGHGKRVQISDKSLKVAKDILKDDHYDDPKNENNNNNEVISFGGELGGSKTTGGFQGFQSGRGKAVKISEASLEAARSMFEETHTEDGNENNNNEVISFGNGEKKGGFVGFQTGRGKTVKASEKSLRAARSMFEDDSDPQTSMIPFGNEEEKKGGFKGFQTGRGKSVAVSEKSLKAAKSMFDDDDDLEPQQTSDVISFGDAGGQPFVGFGGFQTGKGKSVKISEASLKKASSLFDSDEEERGESSAVKRNLNNAQTSNKKQKTSGILCYYYIILFWLSLIQWR